MGSNWTLYGHDNRGLMALWMGYRRVMGFFKKNSANETKKSMGSNFSHSDAALRLVGAYPQFLPRVHDVLRLHIASSSDYINKLLTGI